MTSNEAAVSLVTSPSWIEIHECHCPRQLCLLFAPASPVVTYRHDKKKLPVTAVITDLVHRPHEFAVVYTSPGAYSSAIILMYSQYATSSDNTRSHTLMSNPIMCVQLFLNFKTCLRCACGRCQNSRVRGLNSKRRTNLRRSFAICTAHLTRFDFSHLRNLLTSEYISSLRS